MHLFEEGEHWKVEPGPLGVETLVVQRIVLSSMKCTKRKHRDEMVIRQPPDILTQLCC